MENHKISVLMSIYNETESEIRESIESIINQTYKNIEVIIVVDNPRRTDINAILESIADDRIFVRYNKTNIGLAESMNKALTVASGDIIARMDADDIATLDRFEKEFAILLSGNYDLVCSNYYYIDENSKVLERECTKYNNDQLISYLPYSNTLHHPTVMILKSSITKVNGYRNFPCSQDYDLWLRMMEAGCKFYIMPDKLLYYRIRANSVTESKSFKQIATIRYIKQLYRQRKSKGSDMFSIFNYNSYIDSLKLNDKKYLIKCEKFKKEKDNIAIIRRSNKILAMFKMLNLFIRSDFYRKVYMDNIIEVIGRKFVS